ncbi:protein of unknown function [Maridesulfovibrio hydrothermalis AM13 = DSM 14728]|uniref:Uncharacterized protein n=1 Tax=Maridesulfovibrio hydrothermalis AM13 = DSM 14728 TaxID=1121451 RepID=L0RAP3_9BACT|nr:protein of unknown function [Maridesulfovibrio hydrothermalis AM13 = DSM 14728]
MVDYCYFLPMFQTTFLEFITFLQGFTDLNTSQNINNTFLQSPQNDYP